MTTHEGGCLCGAVRYKVEGDPIISGACYCHACQRVAGGGAAYGMMYPTAALTVTKGSPRSFTSKADSGSDVFRSFCPDCGVHLFSHNSAHPEFRAVKVSTLDDSSGFRSQGAAWTASAQPWHRLDPDLPSWETQPDLS